MNEACREGVYKFRLIRTVLIFSGDIDGGKSSLK
jgi:hypothetical protein